LLRRAFTLGYKARPRKVTALLDLSVHMLEENNVRTGFVVESQYRALAERFRPFTTSFPSLIWPTLRSR